MKKIKLTVLMMAVIGLFLTSCGSDDDPIIDQSPNISFKGGEGYISSDAEVMINQPFTIGVTAISNADSKAKLTSVKYTVTANNEIVLEADSTFKESSYDHDYTFALSTEGEAVIKFIVTDKKGETASKSVKVIAKTETISTELSAAESFTWHREGSQAATGLDMFGLKWDGNYRALKVKIVKEGASKLVKLNPSDWENITTVEDLEKAITNTSDMAAFHEISAEATTNYNIVLGVQNNGAYYMVHLTSAEVLSSTGGTVITITGDYKVTPVK